MLQAMSAVDIISSSKLFRDFNFIIISNLKAMIIYKCVWKLIPSNVSSLLESVKILYMSKFVLNVELKIKNYHVRAISLGLFLFPNCWVVIYTILYWKLESSRIST